jgi:hypothetical protein
MYRLRQKFEHLKHISKATPFHKNTTNIKYFRTTIKEELVEEIDLPPVR